LTACASAAPPAPSGKAPRKPDSVRLESRAQVELDLDFSDRHIDVIEEGFDAVIRGGEPAPAGAPFVLDNAEAVSAAAIEGVGIAYLPDFPVRQALAEGRLTTVFDGSATLQGVFRALWPTSRHMPSRLRVFVDFLAERLGGDARATSVPDT
jgi:DNA-binding transcriptional LysR family regulator